MEAVGSGIGEEDRNDRLKSRPKEQEDKFLRGRRP